MKTISNDEFIKLYGKEGASKFSAIPQKTGIGATIGNAFKSGLSQAASGFKQVGTSKSVSPLDLVEGSGKIGAGIIGAIFSPLAPIFEPTVGKAINYTGEKIGSIPAVQKFATSKAGEITSRVAENVLNYSQIAGTVIGAMEFPKSLGALKTSVGSTLTKLEQEISSGLKELASGKVSKALSIFTGEKNPVIESALKNPTVADVGIKGGDVALRNAVMTAGKASTKSRNQFILAYSKAFQRLAEPITGKIMGGKKILYQFADDLKKNRVDIGNKYKLDFTRSSIKANPGEATKIQAAYDAIRTWSDWTLEGTNELKTIVGRLTKFPTEFGGISKSPFLGRYYHYLDEAIKNSLSKEVRQVYTKLNDKFSKSIGLYDEMVEAFNSGDPFKRIAGAFSDNADVLRQIIEFYEKETGNKISPVVAGRILAQRKQAAFGFLNPRSWIDFFIDPEIQAKIVTKIGRMKL